MAMQDFVDFVETELPRRPVLLRGEEYTGDPNQSDLSIVQDSPIGTFYLQYDENNKAWQKIGNLGEDSWQSVGSGADQNIIAEPNYRDIVFMLGVDLATGRQPQSEIWVPYEGVISDVFVSKGKDSTNSSNIIFNVERYNESYTDDSDWEPVLEDLNLQIENKRRHFETEEYIDNDKLCIRLVSGDVRKLSSMSVVLRLQTNLEDYNL